MGQCLLCGWTESQFWFSTYRAVYNLVKARQDEEVSRYKAAWERTRVICDFVMAAPHKKKTGNGQLFELPWDNEPTQNNSTPTKVLTLEEKAEIFGKRDRKIKRKLENGKR